MKVYRGYNNEVGPISYVHWIYVTPDIEQAKWYATKDGEVEDGDIIEYDLDVDHLKFLTLSKLNSLAQDENEIYTEEDLLWYQEGLGESLYKYVAGIVFKDPHSRRDHTIYIVFSQDHLKNGRVLSKEEFEKIELRESDNNEYLDEPETPPEIGCEKVYYRGIHKFVIEHIQDDEDMGGEEYFHIYNYEKTNEDSDWYEIDDTAKYSWEDCLYYMNDFGKPQTSFTEPPDEDGSKYLDETVKPLDIKNAPKIYEVTSLNDIKGLLNKFKFGAKCIYNNSTGHIFVCDNEDLIHDNLMKIVNKNIEPVDTYSKFAVYNSKEKALDAEYTQTLYGRWWLLYTNNDLYVWVCEYDLDGRAYDMFTHNMEEIEIERAEELDETARGSESFWKWFNGSKVVDKDGKPLVVYHGTNAEEFNEFKLERENDGFYFTADKEYAKSEGKNVIEVYLNIKNPRRITYSEETETIEEMKKEGYDGIIITDMGYYVAFYPNQIKSIKNGGRWDGSSNNIYETVKLVNKEFADTKLITTAYELNAYLKNNTESRVVYDVEKNWFLVGDSETSIHIDLINDALFSGLYKPFEWNGKTYPDDDIADSTGGKILYDMHPKKFVLFRTSSDSLNGEDYYYDRYQYCYIYKDYCVFDRKGDFEETPLYNYLGEPIDIENNGNVLKDEGIIEQLNEYTIKRRQGIEFVGYHGSKEPDMKPREKSPLYLCDDYKLALAFAKGEIQDDGLYYDEIPTVFTFKGRFNKPYYMQEDQYDDEGQDSNIDYEKWVDDGYDGIVVQGGGTSKYYIVLDTSKIRLVDKKEFPEYARGYGEENDEELNESVIYRDDGEVTGYYTRSSRELLNIIDNKYPENDVRVLYDIDRNLYMFSDTYSATHFNLILYMILFTNVYDNISEIKDNKYKSDEVLQDIIKSKIYLASFKIFRNYTNDSDEEFINFLRNIPENATDGYSYGYTCKINDKLWAICRDDEIGEAKQVPLLQNKTWINLKDNVQIDESTHDAITFKPTTDEFYIGGKNFKEEDEDCCIYKIMYDGNKIGYLAISEYSSGVSIDGIEIDEPYRNQGFGTRVVNLLKKKYNRIYVRSVPDAKGFWEKQGHKSNYNKDSGTYDGDIINESVNLKKLNRLAGFYHYNSGDWEMLPRTEKNIDMDKDYEEYCKYCHDYTVEDLFEEDMIRFHIEDIGNVVCTIESPYQHWIKPFIRKLYTKFPEEMAMVKKIEIEYYKEDGTRVYRTLEV